MRSIPIGDHSGEISAADYSPPLAADIPSDLAGMRLDQALARLFPQHSRNRLQHWVREGRVTLDDGPAKADVAKLAEGGCRLVLHEGRKRQVRRMLAAVGYKVERLVRTRVGGLELGELPSGSYRELSAEDLAIYKEEAYNKIVEILYPEDKRNELLAGERERQVQVYDDVDGKKVAKKDEEGNPVKETKVEKIYVKLPWLD